LKLFNSKSNYLFDVGETFSYTVDTKLVLKEEKNLPKQGKLEYGNDVKFSFKVFDEISKTNIWTGTKEASAYLVLQHDAGKPSAFTSVRHSIAQVQKNSENLHFYVDWSVNPNALKGPARLSLIAQAPDSTEVPLLSGGNPWGVDVDIGGNIDVSRKSFSGKLNEDIISYLVEFELSCQQKKLKGAQLHAVVNYPGSNHNEDVPVAVGAHGHYQVSWSLKNKDALPGEYKINVFRQVDKKRNIQEPFLSISHKHVPPAASPLPVRTEFVILVIFVVSFVFVSLKKMEIQGTRQAK